MVKIKVPATSANLGPGFDTLGMALNLYQEVAIEANSLGKKNVIWQTSPHLSNEENLVVWGLERTLSQFHQSHLGYTLVMVSSSIPMSRGLGSSAAAIVCGVMCANVLLNNHLTKDDILQTACALEGHPDNVVPAILGNLTLSYENKGAMHYESIPFPDSFAIVALIPECELSTEKARQALPSVYSPEACYFNVSRTALLIHALHTQRGDLLKRAFEDALHQPYRLPLIPDGTLLFQMLDSYADGHFISGAGPTIIAITCDMRHSDQHLKSSLDALKLSTKWNHTPLKVVTEGACYEPISL